MTARPKVSTCLWFDRDGEEPRSSMCRFFLIRASRM